MRIVLRETVEKLGRRGDILKVADGFARNYLLPKKLAFEATDANLKRIEQERKVREVQESRERQDAQSLADRISQLSLTAVRKVGENEALYGSVTNADVAEMMEKEGFSIDKRKILLDEPIRALGIYDVAVKLHHDVTASVKVWVVKE
ncbi:MAG TPA: 50S ribosomal protein L9 [Candidatus Polarisedimenticolia bacterium]|nr:50S ribosomal protein L9 [Candidatus Polarisedimenticolia bacterium]